MRSRLLLAPLFVAVAAFALPSLAAAHVRHGAAAATVQRQGAPPTPPAASPTSAPPVPAASASDAGASDSGNVARYVVIGIVLVTLGAMVVVLAVLWWRSD